MIFEAARHDAGRAAAELIAAGEDPHARLPDGRTPLMVACTFGSNSVVSVLLEAGADPAALTVRFLTLRRFGSVVAAGLLPPARGYTIALLSSSSWRMVA